MSLNPLKCPGLMLIELGHAEMAHSIAKPLNKGPWTAFVGVPCGIPGHRRGLYAAVRREIRIVAQGIEVAETLL